MNDTPRLTKQQSQLAERGMPIAVSLARLYSRQWPKISAEDFRSVGYEAAVMAAASFDPAGGASFETFANIRINGAMLYVAAREHKRARILRANLTRASGEKWKRELTIDEVLEAPEPTRADHISDLRERMADLFAGTFAGGTSLLTGGDEAVLDFIEAKEAITELRTAVQKLDREERAFVRLYYEEGLKPDEVADRLHVIRRAVFRIQKRVRKKLAEALGLHREDVEEP